MVLTHYFAAPAARGGRICADPPARANAAKRDNRPAGRSRDFHHVLGAFPVAAAIQLRRDRGQLAQGTARWAHFAQPAAPRCDSISPADGTAESETAAPGLRRRSALVLPFLLLAARNCCSGASGFAERSSSSPCWISRARRSTWSTSAIRCSVAPRFTQRWPRWCNPKRAPGFRISSPPPSRSRAWAHCRGVRAAQARISRPRLLHRQQRPTRRRRRLLLFRRRRVVLQAPCISIPAATRTPYPWPFVMMTHAPDESMRQSLAHFNHIWLINRTASMSGERLLPGAAVDGYQYFPFTGALRAHHAGCEPCIVAQPSCRQNRFGN